MPNIAEAHAFVDERAVIDREMDLRAAEQSLDLALHCCERAGLQDQAGRILPIKMAVVKHRRRLGRR